MKNLIGPNIGLHFMRHNSVVIDTTHGLIHFPHLTMQAKNAFCDASAQPQIVLSHNSIRVPPMTTKTFKEFVLHSSEWHTTGTGTPEVVFMEAASLPTSHSLSSLLDKKQQYESLTQRNHQIQSRKIHILPICS